MVALSSVEGNNPLAELLTPRWTPLRYHAVQDALWRSKARFKVVPAGRRSGKTEILKRHTIKEALKFSAFSDGWFILAAPVHDQAKRIYWADLKRLCPSWAITQVFEAERTIRLVNGTEISVLGMDQPQRAEGRPVDGIGLDEFADMKPSVWTKHIRPALSTIGRPGWAWFTGVPEGRNHYHALYKYARDSGDPLWEAFHWKSAEILDPEEIAAAKRDLDRLTFEQEYEASFLNFEGRAYYDFDEEIHCVPVRYNPDLPLILMFDFNIKPGVCAIGQEQEYRGHRKDILKGDTVTCLIDEVWIPDNSNTVKVCNAIVRKFGHHKGDVLCYGDASGGARKTTNVAGSDWAIVKQILGPEFENHLKMRYKRSNPAERSRLNAMNSRIRSSDHTIRMLVNKKKCPHIVDDLEGVSLIDGGSGQIDKDSDPMLGHISDGIGYYIEKAYPAEGRAAVSSKEVGQ